MSKWSVECVIKFINIYRKHECLWNPKNENYKFKTAKESALNEIIKELNMPGLTSIDIKLKIKSIRTAYKRELTAVLKSFKDYTPKLFWFKTADAFLRPVSMKKRKKGSYETQSTKSSSSSLSKSICKIEASNNNNNITSSDNIIQKSLVCTKNESDDQVGDIKLNAFIHSNNEGDVVVTTVNDSNVQYTDEICTNQQEQQQEISNFHEQNATTAIIDNHGNITTTAITLQSNQDFRGTINNLIDSNSDKSQSVSSTMNNNRSIEEDDYFIFGRSIAAQLRSIPDLYSRSVAKYKIQQILFQAETGEYKKRKIEKF